MNFYAFHLGDYASATRHLSWDEDCAFRRLLDAYYTNERPLPSDLAKVFRLVGAGTDVQRDAVRVILGEFFQATDEGYRNTRADEEIAAYRVKQAKARESGLASGRSRRAARDLLNDRSTVGERSLNEASTPNPNPNPIPKRKDTRVARFDAVASLSSQGVEEGLAREFVTYRRKAPLTASAVAMLAREAGKAGWSLADALREAMARGWTGFKAEWVAKQGPRTFAADVAHTTTPTPPNADAALRKLRDDDKRAVPPPPEVRERMRALTKKGPSDGTNAPV